MLADTDYQAFCGLVETQSLRHVRRYLDYGKRIRHGEGLTELHQWLGRILLDGVSGYDLQDKASAFEIGVCEWLAMHWDELNHPEPGVVTVAGAVDKVRLIRLLVRASTASERAALAVLFRERYRRTWAWVGERVTQLPTVDETGAAAADVAAEDGAATVDDGPAAGLFHRFLEHLERLDPLAVGSATADMEERMREAEEREERLRRELAATTHRAERAATRVETLQEELTQLRRTVREESENGDKLREERSRRILTERQAREAAQELERIKSEYLKLDSRMRQSAQREGGGEPVGNLAEVARLAQLDPLRLLGLSPDATKTDLDQARRRFAAAFHSDRTSQLPTWVGELFDQLLAAVNSACDRSRR